MKKQYIFIFMCIILLTGCEKEIKAISIEQSQISIAEANEIMKKAWNPVYKMTSLELETRPSYDIYTKDQFSKSYDFSHMNDRVMEDIFDTVVNINSDGIVRDGKGMIGSYIVYIPTVHADDVYIDEAFIKVSTYEKEYSFLDSTELIIREKSNGKNHWIEGFNRTSILKRKESGDWILDNFEGTLSIGWNR